ncbi:MAG: tetratricopeptide repeat protein [Gemmatimonadota bacterium]|nr:tetratricopeptide repeat protein [Gemmatimonadota bacterium]
MRVMRVAAAVALFLLPLLLVPSSTARAQAGDGFVVAVLPFGGVERDRSEDLQEKMIDELDELGTYELVEQETVNDAVEEAGLRPGATISQAAALRIGRSLDARLVAFGSVGTEGDRWTVDPTFVEVTTRNTQELPKVSDDDLDDLGERVVEAFNTRNQADKHVIFGRDYIRGENYRRAITNFRKALEYDPELAPAYYWIGQAYLKMDSLDQALDALENAVRIDPTYISAYHTIGTTYLEQGDTLQAKSFFEELVRQQPEDCDIQIAYGYVMANQLGETRKGLEAFEKAKDLCPENPRAYQYLAFALPDDRRQEKIENFKRYLELSEGKATDPEALEFLFGLYFAEQRYQEAKETVLQALESDPGDANLQLYAGIVNDKLGDYRKAIERYDRALELNPDLERAYLFRALAHKELGNTTKYAQDLERAGKGRASEIIASQFVRQAHQNLQRGRAGAALEQLNRATQLGGDRCAINYYRGDAYYRMGKALQGENQSISQNRRSIDMFQQAISSLQNACGRYTSYANGLIGNAREYINRGETILKKIERGR